MTDPLRPHLLDMLADPVTAEGLILIGGHGLRLKQQLLMERGARTLFEVLPEARATIDLDFFLKVEFLMRAERGRAVRRRLDELGYEALTPNMQFCKPLSPGAPDQQVKVDILSRLPEGDETKHVWVRGERVRSRQNADLHGRQAPEAFAVEDSPDSVPLQGLCSDGTRFAGEVCVPNAYSWLNLKVAAAGDWLRATDTERREKARKHVFDVLVLVAMLTEEELTQCMAVRDRYLEHPRAATVRGDAVDLFGTASSPGVAEIRRQVGDLDHPTFWEAVRTVLGIGPTLNGAPAGRVYSYLP